MMKHFKRISLLILLILVAISLLLGLGIWQLQRADQKKQLEKLYTYRQQIPPLNLSSSPVSPNLAYRHIKITGHFDNKHVFLLDNKIYQHKIGYNVVAAFRPASGSRWLLVDRGWIPQQNGRKQLPVIKEITGQVGLTGILIPKSAKAFRIGRLYEEKIQWPLRIQQWDLKAMQSLLGYPLSPYVLELNEDQPFAFKHNGVINMISPARHVAYAVQWFLLAVILLIVVIAIIIKRRH